MPNITLSVPEDLKKEMEKYPEINWSEVARESFRQKIVDLNFLRSFRLDSEITPEEALKLGEEVNKLLLKHYKPKKE